MTITSVEGQNSLITLQYTLGKILLFLGLFPFLMAMFSFSSIQLTATLGALYEDIITNSRDVHHSERIESYKELKFARKILVIAA